MTIDRQTLTRFDASQGPRNIGPSDGRLVELGSSEDEYSYVVKGRMGAILGDDVVYAEAGDFVFKPREQWHTFWNDGDEPCHILEIIAPGGFEHYFDELGDIVGADGPPDLDAMMALNERYGLEMKPETVPEICAKYGLWHPMLDMTAA